MCVRMLLTIATAITVAATAPNSQILRDDPDLPDSVLIDSVVAYVTGPGVIPVNFFNDEPLAGIEVTVIHSSPDVTVDSFSFVGSRVQYVTFKGSSMNDSTITIYCFPVTEEPLIPAGSGLFGHLHFSWAPTIAPQIDTVDSITIVKGDIEYSTTFSDSTSNAFKPQFQKGCLDIQENPGCCVGNRGNVDGMPDNAVNVADITYLVEYLFFSGPTPPCEEESDVDATGSVNVADLTFLVEYLFFSGPAPASCP